MSTPKLISVPNKEDLATAGPQYITGKVQAVVTQSGGPGVVITGGQNPGQYPIRSSVVGAVEAALTAMTNKVNVWASKEDGYIVAFAVYVS